MSNVLKFIIDHPLIMIMIADMIVGIWWIKKFDTRLNIKFGGVVALTIASIVVALVSLKLLAIIEVGGDLSRAANMRLYGALFTLPLLYFAFAKIKKVDVRIALDVASIIACLGLFCGRMGCFVGGCCEGDYIFYTAFRWPIRELEQVFYIVFVLLYAKKIVDGKTYGQVYPVLMLSYGIFRFVIEWVRIEYTGGIGFIHLAHIWSLVSILVGAAFCFELENKKRMQKKRRTKK